MAHLYRNVFSATITLLAGLLLASCGGQPEDDLEDPLEIIDFNSCANVQTSPELYTTTQNINLSFNCPFAGQMYVTNEPGCTSGGEFTTYSPLHAWNLMQTNSAATVYVKFVSPEGTLESQCYSTSIIHDDIAPSAPSSLSLGVIPDVLSQSPSFSYTAGSDSGSGILRHEISIKHSSGSEISGFQEHASGNAINGLSLTHGETYTASIRALDHAGLISSEASISWVANDACMNDTEAPLVPANLNISGVATPSTSGTLGWDNSSDNCGISYYNVAIGTAAGQDDIVSWSNIGNTNSFQATSLNLLAGTDYYFSIQSVDTSGNSSTVISSNSWQATGSVIVTGLANDSSPVKSKSWTWNCDNSPCTFRHAVNTNASHTFSGADVYGATTSDSQSSGDAVYYLHVQAKDAAGFESPVASVSAIIDNTAPVASGTLNYSSITNVSTQSPEASWTAFTETNSVSFFEMALGTTAGGIDVLGWTNIGNVSSHTLNSLSLSEGVSYYISVRAEDTAGNVSAALTGSAFQYDGTVPTVVSVLAPNNGSYATSNFLDFTVSFSENVSVTNIPRLPIQLDSGLVYATYLSGSGSNALVFRYTVASPDADTDGIALTNSLDLNTTGLLQDSAGNNAVLSYTSPDTSLIFINNQSVAVTGLANDTTPTNSKSWTWSCDDTPCTFRYAINQNSTHSFSSELYDSTTTASQTSGDGTYYLHVQAKNISGFESSVASVYVVLDNTAPSILAVVAPLDGTYITNDFMDFTVSYSESVDVTGTPRLAIQLNTGVVYADYNAGSGSDTLVFRYQVETGTEDTDGIALQSPLDLNTTGIIRDTAVNNASLTFTSPNTSNITVNPTIVGSIEWDLASHDFGSPGADATQVITLTNNSNVTTSALSISVSNNGPKKFTAQTDNCSGVALTPGSSCTVEILYKWKNPTGTHTATVEATDGVQSDSVSFSGTR